MPLFGTIILADYVSEAVDSKFIISGTYSSLSLSFQGDKPTEHHRRTLQLYVRFNPERVGVHKVVICIKDQHRQVYDESLVQFKLETMVTTANSNVELAVTTPMIGFLPQAARQIDGSRFRFDSTIELHVDGELIGATPLWIVHARQ